MRAYIRWPLTLHVKIISNFNLSKSSSHFCTDVHIRDNSSKDNLISQNGSSRVSPESVDEEEELHQTVVRVLAAGRLQDVDVLASDALLEFDVSFAVRKFAEDDFADAGSGFPCNQFRHFRVRRTAENFEGAGTGTRIGSSHFSRERCVRFRKQKSFRVF